MNASAPASSSVTPAMRDCPVLPVYCLFDVCLSDRVSQVGREPNSTNAAYFFAGRQVGWDPQVPVSWDFPSLPQGRHWSSSDGLGSGLPEAEILICDSAFNAEVRTAEFQEMEEAENLPCSCS